MFLCLTSCHCLLFLHSLLFFILASGRSNVVSEDERGVTSEDDEALSDSESSVASLNDRKKSFEQVSKEKKTIVL